MISAVLVCLNEAEKLENCLENIKDLIDEIIVVDLESIDNTKDIAEKFKAKYFIHKKVDYVELVRNYAISKAKGNWVLILDPDEILSEDLKLKLKETIQKNEYDAVNIPRKNIFFGKWIAHTNWWPDRHIRFFKKDKVFWSERIHSYPKVYGKVLNLPAKENLALIHFGYSSVKEFLDRQNRYSTIEAQNRFDNGERFSWWRFVWLPKREFLSRYIKHQGYLDGFLGFALVLLLMIYQISVQVKVWELQQKVNK